MVTYCQTTGVIASHATHCATYCTPCRPLIRAFSGWIRTPPPTSARVRSTPSQFVHHGRAASPMRKHRIARRSNLGAFVTCRCTHRLHPTKCAGCRGGGEARGGGRSAGPKRAARPDGSLRKGLRIDHFVLTYTPFSHPLYSFEPGISFVCTRNGPGRDHFLLLATRVGMLSLPSSRALLLSTSRRALWGTFLQISGGEPVGLSSGLALLSLALRSTIRANLSNVALFIGRLLFHFLKLVSPL